MKVNWADKVDNIKSLSDELNLSLDSFVFIDDSPVERESIKKVLPEVTVFDFPKDTSELESKIIESYEEYFLSYKTTEEDRERSEMYRSEINRKKIREKVTNFEDFLLSLEMKVSIWKARKLDVERISQLTQRTNQFNVTTRRYSIIDVNKMLEDPNYYLYVASLADKFGNCGIISVIIIKAHGSKAEIDTFLLSCRVMGRYVEDAIIEAVEQRLRENGVNEIYAQYIPTKKNFPVKELFERLGYTLISIKEDGTKDYKLDLSTFPNCRKLLAKVIWHED
jgi:FkbH-like protein